MTEKRFQKGIVFENDTYYKADKPRYDIYPEDCVRTSNELYFPYTPKMVRDMPVGFFLRDLQNVTLFAYGTSAAAPSVLRQQDGRLSAVLLFHNFRLFPK